MVGEPIPLMIFLFDIREAIIQHIVNVTSFSLHTYGSTQVCFVIPSTKTNPTHYLDT